MFASFLSAFVDGSSVPPSAFNCVPPEREADEFAHHPVKLNLGKAEAQWVGALLLQLCAEQGEWRAVPWRKLRNAYLGYGAIARWRRKGEARLPERLESDGTVFFVSGQRLPVETLHVGIKSLLDRGLVQRFTLEDEDYLLPTEKLLDTVPRADDGFGSA
jgi:hypothetical protein